VDSRLRLGVFDWNGTVTEKEADHALFQSALREIYRAYGATPPVPGGERLHYTEVLQDIADRKIGADPRDLDRIREEYIIARWHQGLIRPEIYEVMEYFHDHGIPCAIVSGENSAVLQYGLYASGLDRFISVVEADVYVRGENKVPFLCSVLDHFSVRAAQAFLVDDTHCGVADARMLGMQSVAMLGGFDTNENLFAAEPSHVISQLTCLKTIWDL
jgi:beta-phosphoglucomutase-like phosphatase (HAD superfamily)